MISNRNNRPPNLIGFRDHTDFTTPSTGLFLAGSQVGLVERRPRHVDLPAAGTRMLHTRPPLAALRQPRPTHNRQQLIDTAAPSRTPRCSRRSLSCLTPQCTGQVQQGCLLEQPLPAPERGDKQEAGVEEDVRGSQAGPTEMHSSQAGPAGSSSSSSSQRRQERSGHPHWLLALNESTKWVVSGVAGLVLLLKHDAPVMWCLLGSIVSAFLNKALKHAINEQRPRHARKADPGMPSSHANSLAFLGVYTAAALVAPSPSAAALALEPQPGARLLLYAGAAAVTLCSLFLTWLRVALGYHTVPQVVVGYLLGGCTALAWLQLGLHQALPFITQHASLQQALQAATYLAAATFAVKNTKPWILGLLSHLRHLSSSRTAPST